MAIGRESIRPSWHYQSIQNAQLAIEEKRSEGEWRRKMKFDWEKKKKKYKFHFFYDFLLLAD